ncbi:MAG: hypothetical protein AAB360_01500 [Patescibacteria group bacterium]
MSNVVAQPEIGKLRKSFKEIVDFLNLYDIKSWLGRGLVLQVFRGIVDDDEIYHDIDFHILESDRKKLENAIQKGGYHIEQNKGYKIQINAKKEDSRRYEFVFLKLDGKEFTHCSQEITYRSPTYLFNDKCAQIDKMIIRIPWPLDEYIRSAYLLGCKSIQFQQVWKLIDKVHPLGFDGSKLYTQLLVSQTANHEWYKCKIPISVIKTVKTRMGQIHDHEGFKLIVNAGDNFFEIARHYKSADKTSGGKCIETIEGIRGSIKKNRKLHPLILEFVDGNFLHIDGLHKAIAWLVEEQTAPMDARVCFGIWNLGTFHISKLNLR